MNYFKRSGTSHPLIRSDVETGRGDKRTAPGGNSDGRVRAHHTGTPIRIKSALSRGENATAPRHLLGFKPTEIFLLNHAYSSRRQRRKPWSSMTERLRHAIYCIRSCLVEKLTRRPRADEYARSTARKGSRKPRKRSSFFMILISRFTAIKTSLRSR